MEFRWQSNSQPAGLTCLVFSKTASLLDDRLNLMAVGEDQTLNAALAWSYDLLDQTDVRLSVFAGGFTFEAADDDR